MQFSWRRVRNRRQAPAGGATDGGVKEEISGVLLRQGALSAVLDVSSAGGLRVDARAISVQRHALGDCVSTG